MSETERGTDFELEESTEETVQESVEMEEETEAQEEEIGLTELNAAMEEKEKESRLEDNLPSQQLRYSAEELDAAYKFLQKYQVNTEDLSDSEVILKCRAIQSYKEANVQVLSRGRTLDGIERLLAYVPKGYVGEFKSEDNLGQARARALGWRPFSHEEASKDTPTGKGDTLVRLGDQILMIMTEDQYIALRIGKSERISRKRDSRNPEKEAKEETKGFLAPVGPM